MYMLVLIIGSANTRNNIIHSTRGSIISRRKHSTHIRSASLTPCTTPPVHPHVYAYNMYQSSIMYVEILLFASLMVELIPRYIDTDRNPSGHLGRTSDIIKRGIFVFIWWDYNSTLLHQLGRQIGYLLVILAQQVFSVL